MKNTNELGIDRYCNIKLLKACSFEFPDGACWKFAKGKELSVKRIYDEAREEVFYEYSIVPAGSMIYTMKFDTNEVKEI